MFFSRHTGPCLLAGLLSFAPLAASADEAGPSPWQHTLDASVQYYSWLSSRGWPANVPPGAGKGKGDQLYIPFGYRLEGPLDDGINLQMTLRSGYTESNQDTAGLTGSTGAITDTSLTTTATLISIPGLQPYLSLGLNMPTGTTLFAGGSAFSKMDPDVVALPTFGEGWNIAPTLGFNIPLSEQVMVALGFGYNYRGPFKREGAPPSGVTRLDPGDVYTVNGSLGYQDEIISAQFSASWSMETATTLDHNPFYRAGGRYLLSATFNYAFDDHWSGNVGASLSHYGKNDVLTAGLPPLIAEAFNSNSNAYPVNFGLTYAGEEFSVGPTLSYLYRDENAWSPTSYQFLPAKESWTAGINGQYAVSDRLSLTSTLEHSWLSEERNPDKAPFGFVIPGSGTPSYATLSWRVSFGVSYGL